MAQVSNAVGSWGAYISDFLLTIFGYMSYILVYWLLWPIARHFFLTKHKVPLSDIYTGLLGVKVLGWILVVLSGATLFSLLLEPGSSFLPEEGGGLIGSTVSSLFIVPLSFIGSLLLFSALLLLGLTLSIEVSWIALINKLQQLFLTSGSSFGFKLSELIISLRENKS